MADHTEIEWTDATWSPITGCSIVAHARRSERREDPIAGRVIDRDDAGREEAPEPCQIELI